MRRAAFLGLALLFAAGSVFGAEPHLGAPFHDYSAREGRKVVDLRCTLCHDRERIEEAMREQRDMEKIQARMEGHGAILSERDKAVLGTFWGDPLKDDGSTPRLPRTGK